MGAAADRLARETTVNGILQTLCAELVDGTPADACALSRVIGLLLVEIADHTRDGRRLALGRGYLLPDYPLTQEVIERREPRAISVDDGDGDPSEIALLRELGYDHLLMLPLELDGRPWALVEIYRTADEGFGDEAIAAAREIIDRAGIALERVQRPAA